MRFALIFIIFVVSTANADTTTYNIPTARGIVSLEKTPQKLAVFDIGVLDTLDALDIEVQGITNKTYVDYLSYKEKTKSGKTITRIGSLFLPNMEVLNQFKPDLIIVAARSTSKLKALKNISNTIDLSIKEENYFNALIQRLDHFGRLFNKEQNSQTLKNNLFKLLNETKANTPKNEKFMVVMLNGQKISLFGKKSRIGWLEKELGINIIDEFNNNKPHGIPISFEYIAKKNPDWLLVIDRNQAIGKKTANHVFSTLNNPLVNKTNAWKNNKIIYLDSAANYIALAGYTSITHTLEDLNGAFKTKNKNKHK